MLPHWGLVPGEAACCRSGPAGAVQQWRVKGKQMAGLQRFWSQGYWQDAELGKLTFRGCFFFFFLFHRLRQLLAQFGFFSHPPSLISPQSSVNISLALDACSEPSLSLSCLCIPRNPPPPTSCCLFYYLTMLKVASFRCSLPTKLVGDNSQTIKEPADSCVPLPLWPFGAAPTSQRRSRPSWSSRYVMCRQCQCGAGSCVASRRGLSSLSWEWGCPCTDHLFNCGDDIQRRIFIHIHQQPDSAAHVLFCGWIGRAGNKPVAAPLCFI